MMRKNTPTLLPDSTYHVYNRGINREAIFKFRGNYFSFLKKMPLYLLPVADLYAYNLMKDHFHICLHTHTEEVLRSNLKLDKPGRRPIKSCSWHISNQFASLFKSHAQSINGAFCRTGGLFEEPFRRLPIEDESDLRWLISYIHSNPKLHGLNTDYANYPYSSYAGLTSNEETMLNRDLVLSSFGGVHAFEVFHQQEIPFSILDRLSLD